MDSAFKDEPATAGQLAGALAALGLYSAANTAAEHAEESGRLGGARAYRVRLVNTLLGAVQIEAMMASIGGTPEQIGLATETSSPPRSARTIRRR
jgi:hypothetical protein